MIEILKSKIDRLEKQARQRERDIKELVEFLNHTGLSYTDDGVERRWSATLDDKF